MSDEAKKILDGLTATVPEAGKVLGLKSRTAAYQAVKTGEIQSVRIGGRIVVPTAHLRRMLGIDLDPKQPV